MPLRCLRFSIERRYQRKFTCRCINNDTHAFAKDKGATMVASQQFKNVRYAIRTYEVMLGLYHLLAEHGRISGGSRKHLQCSVGYHDGSIA